MHQKKKPEDRIGHPHHARGMGPESGPVTHGRSRRREIPAIPEANPRWLPQARSWYNSLALSGQSDFYEASDWATAIIAAQSFDTFLRTCNASVLASFVRLSERLCATVTDRKRSGIELAEPERADADDEAADNAVVNWQARLGHRHGLRPVDDGA